MDASPDTPPLAVGAVIAGRYRLERRVAAGGMASVWEAHDDVLARPVAVKVLHPHLAADEQFVARFRREAVAAARLAHPSIVAIYDTCTQGSTEAIVMELVRGPTLREELDRRGRFDPHDAARIVADVADALAVAHGAGIVHRDVKPANVLLSADGRVLVADFGIAKAADGLDLTGTGTTLGTAKYLAPEQVDPDIGPVDGRADVYAAGVILFELLAGAPPFVADGEAATAFARLHRDPPALGGLVPGLDPALEAVARRALARRPDDRIASAAELRDALRQAARGIPPPDGPPTAPVTAVAGPDPTGVVAVDDGTRVASRSAGGPPQAPPAHRRRRPRRRWAPVVVSTLVVVALAVAGVLWFGTGGEGGAGDGPGAVDPTSGTTGGVFEVAGVATFDPPPGDGEEGDRSRLAAVDGDPATTWRTECYETRPFGGLKSGVGLVVELASGGDLSAVHVTSPTPGWSAQVYVADQPAGDLDGWGAPAGAATATGPTTTIDIQGANGRFVLLWLTELAESAACTGRPFGVSVAELSVV